MQIMSCRSLEITTIYYNDTLTKTLGLQLLNILEGKCDILDRP